MIELPDPSLPGRKETRGDPFELYLSLKQSLESRGTPILKRAVSKKKRPPPDRPFSYRDSAEKRLEGIKKRENKSLGKPHRIPPREKNVKEEETKDPGTNFFR